ncbi:hypothetical protein BCON_0030g00520 [Botryotinia convoluta]|uniref:FAD synthase n=1 Tax=Botryotinia convoluta TaxID=54673 RepID=A0A4Z1IKP6_9HELO|nr:hypothetical protein BCON_0030g00520 [Botryotinia convoluta]
MQDRDENHIEKQWQAACTERGDPDTDTNAANFGVGERGDGDGDANEEGDIDQVGNLLERCDEVAGKVNGFLEEQFGEEEEVLKGVQQQTIIALGVIGECLERYRQVFCEGILRFLEEISFSYNGGKDCLVLLILLLTALSNHQSSSPSSSNPKPKPLPLALPSVYILSPHPFPEVDTFVASSSAHYHLQLSRYASPMKEAFTQYLHDYPVVKAILVGTRRTDPHGADLTHFDLTDGGWPRFMRVHPVIDWHYREIWGFIRHLNIPYCPLYDQGYTSLGGTTDTHPNPVLVAEDSKGEGEGEKKFRPAYELVEDEEERLGRDY